MLRNLVPASILTESIAVESLSAPPPPEHMQGESPAWVNVKIGLVSLIIAWVWMTFGFTIEVINQGTACAPLEHSPGKGPISLPEVVTDVLQCWIGSANSDDNLPTCCPAASN